MSTDREMLEAAARAAGVPVFSYIDSELFGRGINTGELDTPLWNPLADDGDALRLAVKLKMQIWHNTGGTVSAMPPSAGFWHRQREPLQPDAAAATRRAIVRAAAELGRASTNPNKEAPTP